MMPTVKQTRVRKAVLPAVIGATLVLAGCDSSTTDAIDTNFSRAQEFTSLTSQIDSSSPTNVANLGGSATFSGPAAVEFQDSGGNREFGVTATASMTANFDTQTISGNLGSFVDLDPANFETRGSVALTNGTLANDGSFTTDMAGNVERSPRNVVGSPTLRNFSGTSTGQIFDSLSGSSGSHLNATLSGTDAGGGLVSGSIVARR